MVRHMIQFKPSERKKPEDYLTLFKGTKIIIILFLSLSVYFSLSLFIFFFLGLVFPEYFYTFLHDYFNSFTTATQLTPDQCIKKLT